MPKRINLTLSDEAAAVLAAAPYHSRGAYVSGLITADSGRGLTARRRCKCGLELPQRVYFDYGIWAADTDDIETYRARQQPAHDVIAGTGKRLRVGACKPG